MSSPPCSSINDIYSIAVASGIDQVYTVANVPGQGGGITAYHVFINNMWNHYQSTGCTWWYMRLNHWNTQYPAITHPYHQTLKLAKIAFGAQAIQSCGCSGAPVFGCTDPTATNYNPLATADNGSCTYPSNALYCCTDPTALNFNSNSSCTHAQYMCVYAPEIEPIDDSDISDGEDFSNDDNYVNYDNYKDVIKKIKDGRRL